MTNAKAVLKLAEKLGIDVEKFDGMTTAEAIEFIADNYEGNQNGKTEGNN
jgi:hypothetical protein